MNVLSSGPKGSVGICLSELPGLSLDCWFGPLHGVVFSVLFVSPDRAGYKATTQASIVELKLTTSLPLSTSLPQIVMFHH